jgi:hypothetical protein
VALDLAKYLPGKSLFKSFSGVVSASGHDLGYTRDLQLTVHPLGVDGRPSKVGFTIVVHVVSEYQSNGLLLGTQQQVLWGMETSCKTGLKTITAPGARGGTEFTFPFSVKTDGTPIVPGTTKAITQVTAKVEPPVGVDVELTSSESVTDPPPGAATEGNGATETHSKVKPLVSESLPESEGAKVSLDDDDDDDTPPAEEELFDCDDLIQPAIAAMVTGEAGAFDSAWLQSTPDVSSAGTSEELDRLNALADALLKAADGCEPGPDCKVKTVSAPEDAPLSNVKKRRGCCRSG